MLQVFITSLVAFLHIQASTCLSEPTHPALLGVASDGQKSAPSSDAYQQDQVRVGDLMMTRRMPMRLTSAGPCAGAVVYVFAGRQDRMYILLEYLNRLLVSRAIDEIHIWDNAKSGKDERWLESLRNKPHYIEQPLKGDYRTAYKFYAPGGDFKSACDNSDPKATVLVKADDDIVFVDTKTFPAFIEYIRSHPEKFIVHGNVVNNGVAAYYQSPQIPELVAKYPGLKAYPAGGFGGYLWKHGEVAYELHKHFLESPQKFSIKDSGENCIEFKAPGVTRPGQGRFSLNFFGARQASYATMVDLFPKENTADDENLLTTVATGLGYSECMFANLNVAHLSFGPQRAQADKALALYEKKCQQEGLCSARKVSDVESLQVASGGSLLRKPAV